MMCFSYHAFEFGIKTFAWRRVCNYASQKEAEYAASKYAKDNNVITRVCYGSNVILVYNSEGKKLQFPIAQVIAMAALEKSAYNKGFIDGDARSIVHDGINVVSCDVPKFFGVYRQGELWMVGKNASIFVTRGTREHAELCAAEREGALINVAITSKKKP